MTDASNQSGSQLQSKIREIIFGVDTPAGKSFDVILLCCIILSVVAVMLESVASIKEQYGPYLDVLEWFFTVIFTIEYGLRLWCATKSFRYARSFFGIVDILSILPTYLQLFIGGAESLLVIRTLRLLRIFRVLKMVQFMQDINLVMTALRGSLRKILAFLGTVLIIAVIVGTLMYLIEGGPDTAFDSIPRCLYWAVVTVTTVGFGDITPHTPFGQVLAACLMLTGYSIIAVPTGIVSVELAQVTSEGRIHRECESCNHVTHEKNAVYCNRCSNKLSEIKK